MFSKSQATDGKILEELPLGLAQLPNGWGIRTLIPIPEFEVRPEVKAIGIATAGAVVVATTGAIVVVAV